jgi:hypothetical protein
MFSEPLCQPTIHRWATEQTILHTDKHMVNTLHTYIYKHIYKYADASMSDRMYVHGVNEWSKQYRSACCRRVHPAAYGYLHCS